MKKYILTSKNVRESVEVRFSDFLKRKAFRESSWFEIKEDPSISYQPRTAVNASEADVTIAVAADFSTYGEIATRKAVKKAGKIYILYTWEEFIMGDVAVAKFAELTSSFESVAVNVAGNGIYTWVRHNVSQALLNKKFILFFNKIKTRVNSLRSGGQTGSDQAGAIAGIAHEIPTIVYMPKKCRYRDINNKDIYDCNKSKLRFEIPMVIHNIKKSFDIDVSNNEFIEFVKGKTNLYLLKK